ncbi:MAG: hypothetical protein WD739_01265 [Actinomycetota bacterium]
MVHEELREALKRQASLVKVDETSARAALGHRMHERGSNRGRLPAIVVAVVMSVAAIGWLVVSFTSGAGPGEETSASSSVPTELEPTIIPAGDGGRFLVVGPDGSVLVGTYDALLEVDAQSGTQETIIEGDGPTSAAYVDESIWITGIATSPHTSNSVSRLNSNGSVAANVPLPGEVAGLVTGADAQVWVTSTSANGRTVWVSEVDPALDAVESSVDLATASPTLEAGASRQVWDIQTGDGRLWILAGDVLEQSDEGAGPKVVGTRLYALSSGDSSFSLIASVPGATAIAYRDGRIWASRGTDPALGVDTLTGAVTPGSSDEQMIVPFFGPDDDVLFIQGSESEWEVAALDGISHETVPVADVPETFTQSAAFVDSAWEPASSTGWILNERGDLLKLAEGT